MRRIFPAILSLCMLSLAMSTASAQIRKIPAAVTEAFEARYPDAQQVEWRDKLSAFTASFELKSVAYQASFNSGGEWLQTEHEVDADDLPDPVQDGFEKSRFADWNLERADLIELPDDAIQYRLLVSKGDIRRRHLFFNEKGRLLKDRIAL